MTSKNHCYNYHNSGHYPASCLLFKTRLLGTGFCPHLQVELNQVGPKDRASLSLQTPATETSSIYWVHPSRFSLKTETESSLENVVF
jgi:hypothetical protein